MAYIIAGAFLGALFFVVPLWAYMRGVRDGMGMAKGIPPEPLQTPVQAYTEGRAARETKEQDRRMVEGMESIFSYTGFPKGVGGIDG